ncbi:MAG: hypothetical protein HOG78_00905 [Rhodobacterales bacterium]|jgi:hypothetical protein|nr:hypothetical protein [Rhodobacterales bacterium]
MKSIRIAILLGAPLTEQNFERIGIPYLSPYFEVMVFDCMGWLGRSSEEIACKEAHLKHRATIKTEIDLEIATKKYQPDYAIDAIGLSIHSARAKNILTKLNVKFVVPKMGCVPAASFIMKLKKFLSKRSSISSGSTENSTSIPNDINKKKPYHITAGIFIKKIIDKLNQRRAIRRVSFSSDIALLAGNKSLDFFTNKASQIIWSGSQDFHQFNKVKQDLKASNKLNMKEPFILFIDDCLATANDWKLLNLKAPVTATEYFPVLRSFFEKIEILYGMPVVISGHPNSKSDDSYSANMGGRTVIFGSTASLALQSNLVLIHGSTATSFAVLARKPTLFLTTRELDESEYGLQVRTMAKILGSSLIFIDEPDKEVISSSLPMVNVKKYKRYEVNYLRSERSSESAPWQAFIDYVNEETISGWPDSNEKTLRRFYHHNN